MTRHFKTLLGLVAALGSAGAALAAPTIYFGENQTPAGAVSGAPLTARTSFLSGLVGVGSEGFETQTPNSPFTNPLGVSFAGSSGNITATLTGGGFGVVDASFDNDGSGGTLGRFNTTAGGSQWWLAGTTFSIEFSSAVSAFGFYGTDIGDFDGRLTIGLTDTSGATTTLDVGHTVNGADGSLLFWGFIDPTTAYKKITFGNTGNGFDGFGFDDMVIGDQQQIRPPEPAPEPASLALVGAGLLGLAVARRRRAG